MAAGLCGNTHWTVHSSRMIQKTIVAHSAEEEDSTMPSLSSPCHNFFVKTTFFFLGPVSFAKRFVFFGATA